MSGTDGVRVALVQNQDARNVRNWSGTLWFSKLAIARHLGPVIDLSPAPVPLLPFRIARQVIRRTTGRWYSYDHDPALSRFYGRYFSRRIAAEQPDLIFAPAASACIAHLETAVPIIYFSDATWRVMQGYHVGLTGVTRRTALAGEDLERRAIRRARLAVFSSEWAAESAIRDYGADPAKVHTVYIGANLTDPPARAEVLPRRMGSPIQILFVGVSWKEKGGDIAREALIHLLALGYDAELTVIGCAPPHGLEHPRLRVIPFLSKAEPEQAARFARLWKAADMLLFPTRFEAAGIVCCEAGAYGVPTLATRTGGVPSLVVDGRNGYTLPIEAGGAEWARAAARVLDDREHYASLCEGSRIEYERRLNWDAWGAAVARFVEEQIPGFRGRLCG